MLDTQVQDDIRTLSVTQSVLINAPADIVFETLLEPAGPLKDQKLKLEAWVGGRWYRDLGDKTGHLWGHVQVIKPPRLLEITGPMFMSYPVASHLQYRLVDEAGGTRLTLVHKAIGLISPEHQEGVQKGWAATLEDIKSTAEKA